MADHPFAALLNLIIFDQKMRTLHQEIEQLREEVEALDQQQQQAKETLERARDRVEVLRKEVSAFELQIKEMDARESDRKKRLDEISDYKEYRALKAEIDVLQRDQQECEKSLLAGMNKLESAQKEFEIQQAAHDEKVLALTKSIAENNERIAQIEREIKTKEQERAQKEQHVPEEWRDKYSMMRMRVPDPVVPELDGGCSACFQAVTSQEMIRLRNRALVQCKGCFRLLYCQDVMESPEQETTA